MLDTLRGRVRSVEEERDLVARSMAVELRRAARTSENGSASSGGSSRAAIREAIDNLSELAADLLTLMKEILAAADGRPTFEEAEADGGVEADVGFGGQDRVSLR